MKKTDLYLKLGTYIKASSADGDIQGISLENFVVSVLNNPTCCAKPVFIKDGMLMTNTFLSTSLQIVKDQGTNSSPLKLSTTLVRVESNLEVAERLLIEADSTVTTQTSSVIQSSTTNANLVIAPNGTGALVADIPDGTVTGGNLRGVNAVDLQMSRSVASQVASGTRSMILGGQSNTASAQESISGGFGCQATNTRSIALGGSCVASGSGAIAIGNTVGGAGTQSLGLVSVSIGADNTASSNYSTVSGGQSNTASTGTHATVVGGQSNTASGFHSITGGSGCTASAEQSVSFGLSTISSGQASISLGYGNNATNFASIALSDSSLSYLKSQVSIASGTFSGFTAERGESQQSLLTAYKAGTLNTGATTVLSLNGTGVTNLIIPNGNNRAWNVQVNWVAVVTAITGTATGITVGDTITQVQTLGFKRIGGTSSLIGTANTLSTNANPSMSTASIAYTVGGSQEMAITFTAPTFAGAGSITCRVVARIELTEVAF